MLKTSMQIKPFILSKIGQSAFSELQVALYIPKQTPVLLKATTNLCS